MKNRLLLIGWNDIQDQVIPQAPDEFPGLRREDLALPGQPADLRADGAVPQGDEPPLTIPGIHPGAAVEGEFPGVEDIPGRGIQQLVHGGPGIRHVPNTACGQMQFREDVRIGAEIQAFVHDLGITRQLFRRDVLSCRLIQRAAPADVHPTCSSATG